MSNEAAAEKKPTIKLGAARADDKLSRVPVAMVVFSPDPYDGPGSQVSTLTFGRVSQQPRWYSCHWLPSWQMFEIVFHTQDADDVEDLVHVSRVKKWRRA